MLNWQPYPGISLYFILLFFGPLLVGAVIGVFVAVTVDIRAAKRFAGYLSLAWIPATVFAVVFIAIGYGFHHGRNDPTPLVTAVLWFAAGLALIWLPLGFARWAGALPSTKPDGTFEFGCAVRDYLQPLATEHGLSFEQIDARLYLLAGDAVSIKIYFAPCHGFSVGICLSPTTTRIWNAPDERGLGWFLKFLGESPTLPDRVADLWDIPPLVRDHCAPLQLVLRRFTATAEQWTQFQAFYKEQRQMDDKRGRR